MIKENIKFLRKRHKLTQQELGKILNVGQKTVSMWEKGNNNITLPTILKICEYFQISPNELLANNLEDMELHRNFRNYNRLTYELQLENGLSDFLKSNIVNMQLQKISRHIRSLKSVGFIEKLSESWSGNREKMLLILLLFIKHLNKIELSHTTISKKDFISMLKKFKISLKNIKSYSLILSEKDKRNIIEWVENNLDEIDVNALFIDLRKDVEKIIINELNSFDCLIVED
ncbi:TPA: helix-turn-helix transcriptional regulator [Campylobacter lari]|nr:helix-turn-helix transcriptional regulator [Campylobacter lari]